ncbi:hypothetical protein WDW89_05475 [Deltaproteobacteria bacterium TL4]
MQSTTSSYQNRVICLSFSQELYAAVIEDANEFREIINLRITCFMELFPSDIVTGYRMKDKYSSKRQSIIIRRIVVAGIAYTIRPSFVTPYLTAQVAEIEP